jgi:hypothetical protein
MNTYLNQLKGLNCAPTSYRLTPIVKSNSSAKLELQSDFVAKLKLRFEFFTKLE